MNWLKTTVLTLALALAASAARKNVFLGEISDSQCALNVHSLSRSHQEMIKKSTLGTDAASCARACIRRGGEWVLRSGDDVYHLKNQAGIELYAGEMVKVTGELDPKANEINNTGIEILPAKGHSAQGPKDPTVAH